MTPTLSGRWHTRLLLYVLLGLPITTVFALYLNNWDRSAALSSDPFVFITALTVIGILLDPLYMQVQRFRWDNDWPFAFQFFFSVLEFFIAYGVMLLGWLDPVLIGRIPFSIAAAHFSWIFVPSFLALLCGIQLFLVRWRFKGGELGRRF